jgi:hypothetical protein
VNESGSGTLVRLQRPTHRRTITALVDYLEREVTAMEREERNQMDSHREILLEMERRHVREGTERISQHEAIIAKLGDANRSDTAILAGQLLEIMRSSLNLAKRRLRQIEERSKE